MAYTKWENLAWGAWDVKSLDETVGPDAEVARADMVATNAPSAFDRFSTAELPAIIERALLQLTPREEGVIRSRFGIGKPEEATQAASGEAYDIGRDRARQLEARALGKLRRYLAGLFAAPPPSTRDAAPTPEPSSPALLAPRAPHRPEVERRAIYDGDGARGAYRAVREAIELGADPWALVDRADRADEIGFLIDSISEQTGRAVRPPARARRGRPRRESAASCAHS